MTVKELKETNGKSRMHLEKVKEKRKDLENKLNKRKKLHEDLRRSLAIEELWDSKSDIKCWDLGLVTSNIDGHPFRPEKMKFIIKAGDEKREFNLWEIPKFLRDYWLDKIGLVLSLEREKLERRVLERKRKINESCQSSL